MTRPTRENLPHRERAISDAIDEYLIRHHGIITGRTHPVEVVGA